MLATLGLCLTALGCGSGPGQAGAPGKPSPVSVEVVQVGFEELRDVATFSGALSAEHSVMLKAETEGVIEEVLFDEGQPVQEGAVLLRLKSEEQRARLQEAEANLELAREVHARAERLLKRAAASAASRDEAAASLGVAEARVQVARVALARTEIRAPFDGVLGMRLVDPGDRVDEDTPLVQIDAVDRLQVSFSIAEQGIIFARPGLPVSVRVAPYPGEVFPGEIFFVSPTLDPTTRRILAKAWVPNPDGRLRAGLFARVDVEVARRPNAILVPESAVTFDREGTYVWKVLGGPVATRVPIEVGLRKQGQVEVTLGLQPGDRIVSAGTHKVTEGGPLTIANSSPLSGGQARHDPEGGGQVEEGT